MYIINSHIFSELESRIEKKRTARIAIKNEPSFEPYYEIDYPVIFMNEETYQFLYDHCNGYFSGQYSMYDAPIAFANWLKFGEVKIK